VDINKNPLHQAAEFSVEYFHAQVLSYCNLTFSIIDYIFIVKAPTFLSISHDKKFVLPTGNFLTPGSSSVSSGRLMVTVDYSNVHVLLQSE
jgi:hypothetical protein